MPSNCPGFSNGKGRLHDSAHTYVNTYQCATHAPMPESSSSRPVCYDNKHLMSEDIKTAISRSIEHTACTSNGPYSVINLVSFNQILFAQLINGPQ